MRKNIILIVALLSAMIGITLAIIMATSHGSDTTMLHITQPQTASQIATEMKCVRFVDDGPATVGGAIDTGHCWIGSVKYGIDVFPSSAVRDAWIVTAEKFGVSPEYMTGTAVGYKATDQSGS
jgi:hypothetical protein